MLKNHKAIILGTGPSLNEQKRDIIRLRDKGYLIFGVNNTFNDFDLDCWIACDPNWHKEYGRVTGDFDKWHWDKGICGNNNYRHIEGRWGDGLSTDKDYIHYGHSSGYQALNLALHYGATEIYLAGYDMNYSSDSRHYFSGLSPTAGEYPQALRKFSTFDGLIKQYETIARQQWAVRNTGGTFPDIYNCTENSGLTCFPYRYIGDL